MKPGSAPAVEELLSAGPPFDPGDAGLSAHSAYLSDDRVFLVFEGEGARAKALELAKQHMADVSRWQELVWELPSIVADVPAAARCVYRWPRPREARLRR
jgi:hypothetical protein